MVMGINRVIRDTPLHIFHTQHIEVYMHDYLSKRGVMLGIFPSEGATVDGHVFRYQRHIMPGPFGSGLTGLYLAAMMGFDPIYLVGYDLERGDPSHFVKKFPIKVFNVNQGSKLKAFPYRSFEDCRHGEIE